MKVRSILMAAAVALPLASLTLAQQPNRLRTQPLVIDNCNILAFKDLKLAAQQAGIIHQVKVRPGSVVKQGDVLAVIDDRVATLARDRAEVNANNTAPLLIAKAQEKEATEQRDEKKRLFDRGQIVSASEYRLAEARLEIAQRQIDDEIAKATLSKAELQAAEVQLDMHQIKSPINGTVIVQALKEGESVEARDLVFRLIQTDVVKVEGFVPLRSAARIQKGMKIEVYPNVTDAERQLYEGHTDRVNAVKVLPDGFRFASAGEDGVIRIWNVNQSRLERTLMGHDRAVRCLATVPGNANFLVSGGDDEVIRAWNIAQGTVAKSIPTAGRPIHSIAMHPTQANLVVSGHEKGELRVWNLDTLEEVKTPMRSHIDVVTSLHFTPDGKYLVSAGDDTAVRVWDFETGKETRDAFRNRSSANLKQISLSPDGKSFLFNSHYLISVVALDTGMPLTSFGQPPGVFNSVAVFSPMPELILSARDKQLQLWRTATEDRPARLVRTYDGHTDVPTCVDFAPDGNFFVSGGVDRSVRVWLVPTVAEVDKERIASQIEFVNQQVESSLGVMISADVDNSAGLLQPGTFATMVIYPEGGPLHAGN